MNTATVFIPKTIFEINYFFSVNTLINTIFKVKKPTKIKLMRA